MKQSNWIVTKGNLSYLSQSPNEKKPRIWGKSHLEWGTITISTEPEVRKKTWVAGNEVEEEGRGQLKMSHVIQSKHLGFYPQSNEMLLENVKQKSDIKL